MEKLLHAPVHLGGQQSLAGIEEAPEVLDLPERRVPRNPLRGQRARMRVLDLGEVRLGRAVADVEVGVLGESRSWRGR
jgi:hypothetical protein